MYRSNIHAANLSAVAWLFQLASSPLTYTGQSQVLHPTCMVGRVTQHGNPPTGWGPWTGGVHVGRTQGQWGTEGDAGPNSRAGRVSLWTCRFGYTSDPHSCTPVKVETVLVMIAKALWQHHADACGIEDARPPCQHTA